MLSCDWMQAALSPILPELLAVVRVFGGSSGSLCFLVIAIFDGLAHGNTLFLQDEVNLLHLGRAFQLTCCASRGISLERYQLFCCRETSLQPCHVFCLHWTSVENGVVGSPLDSASWVDLLPRATVRWSPGAYVYFLQQ